MSLEPSEYPGQYPKQDSKAKREEQIGETTQTTRQDDLATSQEHLDGIVPIVARGANMLSSQRPHALTA